SQDEADKLTGVAVALDLHGSFIQSARRLRSRARQFLELPRFAVEVQHCSGSRSSALPADQVQRKHFTAGMRVTKPGGEHCARQNKRLCFAVVKVRRC